MGDCTAQLCRLKITHFYATALRSRLGYGGKMGDLVVAVLQLTSSSSWNGPAKPLAVGSGALVGGIFGQTLPHQLPHAHQVTVFYLHGAETLMKQPTEPFRSSSSSQTYIEQLLETSQGLGRLVCVLRVVLFLGLKAQQRNGKKRGLERKRCNIFLKGASSFTILTCNLQTEASFAFCYLRTLPMFGYRSRLTVMVCCTKVGVVPFSWPIYF